MTSPSPVRSIQALLALLLLSTAVPAMAQSPQGAIVSGSVGATAVDSQTAWSFSAAGGYRFNRTFGMGLEFSQAPSIDSDDNVFLPIGRPVDFLDVSGQLTTFTANIRLEVPTTSSRFIPYAVAGGGVANMKRSYGPISLASQVISVPELLLPAAIYPPSCCGYRLSTTSLALTVGGGLSILTGEHLSIDVDLRYLRLMDVTDDNIGRFGVGASYRF